jgi:hypothetical protein
MLNSIGDQIPPVKDLSRKIGVNSGLLMGGIFFVLGLIMMILQGWEILVVSASVLYPALCSI